MKVGEKIWTPRFCSVEIAEVFDSEEELREAGYTEMTYLKNDNYIVLGKSVDLYHMEFAAAEYKNNEKE